MLSSTLALLTRSLKQDSRLLFPHLMRLGLLGFALWSLFMAHEQSRYRGAPGLEFFEMMTWLNFVFICIAGVGVFSSAITEEKEERTVGLLRMAGISPVSLLLGKFVPRLINAVMLLTLQFPFTLLAIALGGVTIHQIAAAYCSLLAFLLALGNVSLLASVVCRTTNRASWLTGVLLVLYLLAAPLMNAAIDTLKWFGILPRGEMTDSLALFIDSIGLNTSIWSRLSAIESTGFAEPVFGTQVISSLIVAFLAFCLAWALAGHFVRDDEMGGVGARFTFRRKGKIRQFPVGRAWTNALVWKDFHFISGGITWMVAKFVVYGVALVIFAIYVLGIFSRFGTYTNARRDFGYLTIICATFVLAGEIAFAASRIFREELRGKTHASLMMLPYSAGHIAYAKIGGCLLGLLPAAFYFVLGYFIAPEAIDDFPDIINEAGAWWFFSMYVLGVHLTAFLSLVIRWGALPLAAGGVILLNVCCLTPLTFGGASGGEDAFFVMLAFGAFTASGFLQAGIGEMMRKRAATE